MVLSLGWRAGGQVVLTLVFILGRRATVLARVVVLILGLRARVRGGVRLQSLTFGCICAVVIKQNSVRCFKSSSRGAPADTSYAVHAACFGAVWSDVRFGHI